MRPQGADTKPDISWAREEISAGALPAKSDEILGAAFYRGQLPRGEVPRVVGTGERQGSRIASALLRRGVLTSESTRAPLRLAFPATLAGQFMPGLFPDKPGET